jgi:flagellar biosynthetic protein FliQ
MGKRYAAATFDASTGATMRSAVACAIAALFNPDVLTELLSAAQHALTVALVLSVPALAAAFVASLAVGWFSSATQVQDPALSFAPRTAAVLLAIVAFGSWGARTLLQFTTQLWQSIPTLVH